MNQIINEGMDYHDMKGQINPVVSIDEYSAKMGDDSDIVTITFITNSKLSAEDLVSWLELGYDFILDASVSEGELSQGKWLVFVEMKRRSNVPDKLMEILSDLETLTDKPIDKYKIKINDKLFDADKNLIKNNMILTPADYNLNNKEEKEADEELNDFREIAGLPSKKIYNKDTLDEEIRKYISNAGL
jgi:hypothetical protein